jgi:hypothetical protein
MNDKYGSKTKKNRLNISSTKKSKERNEKETKDRVRKQFKATVKKLSTTPKSNKQLFCSPYSKSKRVSNQTCFNTDTLDKLIDGYNKKYSYDKITLKKTDSPMQRWEELQKKMQHKGTCTAEVCWIDELLLNKESKEKYKRLLFRPKQPVEWGKDPNTWLSDFDINKIMEQYEKAHPNFKFIGPSFADFDKKIYQTSCVCNNLCNFSIEEQIKNGKSKIGVIFNLDTYGNGGTHWVAFFLDLDEHTLIYFDSNGVRPKPSLVRFKKKVVQQANDYMSPHKIRYYQNKLSHQRTNTECGMYCLYFIIAMLSRKIDILDETSKETIPFDDLIVFFTKQRIPDSFVEQYREKLFKPLNKSK